MNTPNRTGLVLRMVLTASIVPPVVGVLLGMTIAMAIVGLTSSLQNVFARYPSATQTGAGPVAGSALLALAVGVRVPQRLALRMSWLAWHRFLSRGRPSDMSRLLLSGTEANRPLSWVVFSIVALAAGVLTATVPLGVSLVGLFYDWMHAHFVWSIGPLAVLQATAIFVTGAIPFAFLGLTASCLHHLDGAQGRWEPRATAWLPIGAGGGGLIATWIAASGLRRDLGIVAAALPVLVAAVVSAVAGSSRSPDPIPGPNAGMGRLPLWSDRWPRLLRAGVVSVGACGAGAIAVWTDWFALDTGALDHAVVWLLFALGIGLLAGCRRKRPRLGSIGGFGVASAAAGTVVALGSGALAWHIPSGAIGWAVAFAGLASIGFATAYGGRTVLGRVAHPSTAGSVMLSRALLGSGVIVWVGVPIARRFVPISGMLTALALFLLALGGTLIVHEPDYSPRTRRLRLAAVFACMGVMIVLSFLLVHARPAG